MSLPATSVLPLDTGRGSEGNRNYSRGMELSLDGQLEQLQGVNHVHHLPGGAGETLGEGRGQEAASVGKEAAHSRRKDGWVISMGWVTEEPWMAIPMPQDHSFHN